MFGMYGLCITVNFLFCFVLFFIWFFLSVYRMSDFYKYDEYSCLVKLIHGESATVHLLVAEYKRIKFHLDALDVSFSLFVWKCI